MFLGFIFLPSNSGIARILNCFSPFSSQIRALPEFYVVFSFFYYLFLLASAYVRTHVVCVCV